MTYQYTAIITNVVDGDTIDATVDLGFYVQTKVRFRLFGLDTAETNSTNVTLKSIGLEAKSFVRGAVLNKTVTLVTHKTDKYGRWLAEVIIDDKQPSLNEQLIALNLAKRYDGGQKTNLWE